VNDQKRDVAGDRRFGRHEAELQNYQHEHQGLQIEKQLWSPHAGYRRGEITQYRVESAEVGHDLYLHEEVLVDKKADERRERQFPVSFYEDNKEYDARD
jgi:hypothetical protein